MGEPEIKNKHGGRRPGAGRPRNTAKVRPGVATVGKNLRLAVVDPKTGDIVVSHEMRLTPLAYLESVYANENEQTEIRVRAATAAAPFVHKKMPMQIEARIDITADDLVRRLKDGQERARIIEHVPDEVNDESVAS